MPLTQEELLRQRQSLAQLSHMTSNLQEQGMRMEDANDYVIERQYEMMRESDEHNERKNRIVKAMLLDPMTAEQLIQQMPELGTAMTEEMERLQTDAQRSGTEKVQKDFLGKKKRAAKARLEEIAVRRAIVERMQEARIRTENQDNRAMERAAGREIHRGRRWANPLRAAMNYFALGSRNERRGMDANGVQRWADFREVPNAYKTEQTVYADQGILKGVLYTPHEEVEHRKLVIFFSGSGGTNATMVPSVAQSYIANGASVLAMDYRGFGKSISEKTNHHGQKERVGTHLCEASIYEDARTIYEYGKALGYDPADIILHGFSLGGAVASKIAADVAEENARKEHIREKDRLGGLVLHSSIASMYEAAKDMTVALGGAAGWAGAGGYNTREHMRRLCRYDPAQPVHYRGGSTAAGDQLSLEKTELQRDPQAQFYNSSVYHSNTGHQMRNGEAGSMGVTDDQQMLRDLVNHGRRIQQNREEQ